MMAFEKSLSDMGKSSSLSNESDRTNMSLVVPVGLVRSPLLVRLSIFSSSIVSLRLSDMLLPVYPLFIAPLFPEGGKFPLLSKFCVA